MTASDFETCFREQYPKLVALGVAMGGGREAAHELAQETMVRAHARWEQVGEYDAPVAWLRRVMTNLLIDHLRSRSVERSAVDRLWARPGRSTGEPDLGPEWSQLVAPLPPAQRAIVTLYYGEDRSVEEIADILDIAVGTERTALGQLGRHRRAVDRSRPDPRPTTDRGPSTLRSGVRLRESARIRSTTDPGRWGPP